jgi:hypothetical protein
MPGYQVALGYLNQIYGDPALLQSSRTDLLALHSPKEDPEEAYQGLIDTAAQLLRGGGVVDEPIQGVDPSTIANLLGGLPPAIMEAGRAVIYRNLQREVPFGMTFAWAPAYDNEITVWESPPTNISPGWITVLIKGRYPADEHPVTGKGMNERWG